jgi:hypothetical protein
MSWSEKARRCSLAGYDPLALARRTSTTTDPAKIRETRIANPSGERPGTIKKSPATW